MCVPMYLDIMFFSMRIMCNVYVNEYYVCFLFVSLYLCVLCIHCLCVVLYAFPIIYMLIYIFLFFYVYESLCQCDLSTCTSAIFFLSVYYVYRILFSVFDFYLYAYIKLICLVCVSKIWVYLFLALSIFI